MKQLTILSGKGGTGKTSIAASFAVLAENAVVADCDVDAPDLHMLLHPEVIETQQFRGPKVAVINETECIRCGLCKEKCVFSAVTDDLKIDAVVCEGCNVCSIVCPAKAIYLTERISGSAYVSKTKYGFMSHAILYPGESNSGKLVTLVRQNAKILCEKEKRNLIIIDGSPGIGCPVIASITGVDAALVVTEPTLSGIHDLERVLELLNHFNVTPFVCINMYNVNVENANKVLSYCRGNGTCVVGVIPFDSMVTQAMVNGKTVVEYSSESAVSEEMKSMWEKLAAFLDLDE
ncbi:TPA: (4Fe-4S)-binding protein [Candidatus Bathyarchaeota archaeon]|nr:(4Fe-4S)-binding protein [Candidatus Bathyarchaeota archaeon]HIJ08453.1 (4Fe-4S)-binding protein [Candidatus Bathyarchaeota archaeon]